MIQSTGHAEVKNAWLHDPFLRKLLENELLTNKTVNRKRERHRM